MTAGWPQASVSSIQGTNLFLNSFRPKEGDKDNESASAKAQGFMTVNLLGMKFRDVPGDGPKVRNPGKVWWEKPSASRDDTLV